MRPVDFGWDYPPGVTGNEPQITGEDDTLGSCGCIDYHYADCPIVTSRADRNLFEEELEERWYEDFYDEFDRYESSKYIRDEEYDRGEHE